MYILSAFLAIITATIINLELLNKDTDKRIRLISIISNCILLVCVFVFLTYMHGFTYRFVIYAMLAVNLIYISNIDIREQAVSHEIIITSYICGLCVLIWNKDLAWWEPLLSGAVYGLVFALISRATHSALGFGDALITGAIGVYLGFFHTLIVVVYAVIFGGLLSLILFILKRVTKQSTLPFAPFLAIGFFASIIS